MPPSSKSRKLIRRARLVPLYVWPVLVKVVRKLGWRFAPVFFWRCCAPLAFVILDPVRAFPPPIRRRPECLKTDSTDTRLALALHRLEGPRVGRLLPLPLDSAFQFTRPCSLETYSCSSICPFMHAEPELSQPARLHQNLAARQLYLIPHQTVQAQKSARQRN